RRVDSEEFRFVSRTGPSVWWQADCARRAGRRGEAGVGFRPHLGGAVLDAGAPGQSFVVLPPALNHMGRLRWPFLVVGKPRGVDLAGILIVDDNEDNRYTSASYYSMTRPSCAAFATASVRLSASSLASIAAT